MNRIIFLICIVLGSAAQADPNYAVLKLAGKEVKLPLALFRSEDAQRRVLTRKEQILRVPAAGVGKSISRLMTPVKDQGARGTCSVFSAVALLEAFTGERYSEQCLARMSSNTDAGRTEQRLEYVRKNGIYFDKDCPYDYSQRDKIPDLRLAERKRFDSEVEIYPFTEDNPLDYLKSRLAVNSPVGIEFFVVGTDQWRGGPFVYTPDAKTTAMECGFLRSCGSHAVVVTGVNDTLQLIEFKNSWGSGWGKGGYGYVSYDYYLSFGKGVLVSY